MIIVDNQVIDHSSTVSRLLVFVVENRVIRYWVVWCRRIRRFGYGQGNGRRGGFDCGIGSLGGSGQGGMLSISNVQIGMRPIGNGQMWNVLARGNMVNTIGDQWLNEISVQLSCNLSTHLSHWTKIIVVHDGWAMKKWRKSVEIIENWIKIDREKIFREKLLVALPPRIVLRFTVYKNVSAVIKTVTGQHFHIFPTVHLKCVLYMLSSVIIRTYNYSDTKRFELKLQ